MTDEACEGLVSGDLVKFGDVGSGGTSSSMVPSAR
jgi:hypothetical protein